MVLRCACGFDIILELILSLCELCHFLTSDFMKVYIDSGYLVSAIPHTISIHSSCNFASFFFFFFFFHGLKMCMWFGFNPTVIFCYFSTLLTLSFFNFSQVRHQLHRISIYILTEMCNLLAEKNAWKLDYIGLESQVSVIGPLVVC